jgi:hypothetical protein
MNEYEVKLESLKGWDKLDEKTQQTALEEAGYVLQWIQNENHSRAEVGKHFIELRKLLPKGMFLAALRDTFHMSRATAYRYIEMYESISKKLPKPVLDVVLRRAYRPSQIKRIEDNPPPKTSDAIRIGRYLDKLEKTPVEVKQEPQADTDMLLRECINFVTSRYSRLPNNSRARAAWVRSLVGMLMTKFGIGAEQRFEPMAIPEKFRVVRGRPKAAA